MTLPIAIVGASTSGLYLARTLAAAGVRVRVYERTSTAPRPRTLIVTSAYRDVLGDLGRRSIVNEIAAFDLRAGRVSASVPLLRPDLIIERATLLGDLAAAAKEAGAEIVPGHRLAAIDHDDRGATLRFARRGGTVTIERVRTIVAADGATSDVARILRLPRPPLVPLVQALVDLPADLPADTSRVWFDPNATSYFYWLIPESPTAGALGVIGTDGAQARRGLDALCESLGLRVRAYQAARIPAYDRWIPLRTRTRGLDAYVVGDAAGHVKVSTVGGIVTGLRGAEAVAAAILRADGRTAAQRLRLELHAHLLVRRALARFSLQDYESLITGLDPGIVRQLGGISRDEPVRLLLRACRARPGLAALAARRMLGRP